MLEKIKNTIEVLVRPLFGRFYLESVNEDGTANFKSPKAKARFEVLLFHISIFVGSIIIAVLFSVFVGRIAFTPTTSMSPTLVPGDVLFITYIHDEYSVGDIIVFTPQASIYDSILVDPNESTDELLMKRIAAVAGDTIDWDELYATVPEEFLPYLPVRESSTEVVPEGYVLVLGDNTEDSYDSRFWEDPYVPVENIYAVVAWNIPLGTLFGNR